MSLTRDIAIALGMAENDILRIISTAPRRYKIYEIPKRSGRGVRIIAQPARELKSIQRYLVGSRMQSLRIHKIATAYTEGSSILANAEAHRKNRAILKLDFRDFFHSFRYEDLVATLNAAKFREIAPSEWPILRQTFFWSNPNSGALCLSIGAPSSPFLSNVIMERLDRKTVEICSRFGVSCTRYADDITLSAATTEALLQAEGVLRQSIAQTKRPRLQFNDEKRGIYTRGMRRIVTGLVLTPTGKISLGRSRKREISAAIHYIEVGKNTDPKHFAQVRGWLAFALDVEPTFFESMSRKYGPVVKMLMRLPTNNT